MLFRRLLYPLFFAQDYLEDEDELDTVITTGPNGEVCQTSFMYVVDFPARIRYHRGCFPEHGMVRRERVFFFLYFCVCFGEVVYRISLRSSSLWKGGGQFGPRLFFDLLG